MVEGGEGERKALKTEENDEREQEERDPRLHVLFLLYRR